MSILEKFEAVAVEDAKQQLGIFLTKFNNPAFVAMPKREIELAVFELLRDLKLIDEKAPIYDLMTELRVTRPKASQLLFDLEVRKHGGNKGFLDNEIQSALIQTKFAKDGDFLCSK